MRLSALGRARGLAGRARAGALRIFLYRSQVHIHPGCSFEGWPRLTADDDATIRIGPGVVLRRNVELRAHRGATIEIGRGSRIDRDVRMLATNGATLRLQSEVRVGLGCVMNGGDDLEIGERSLCSGYVYLQTSQHRHEGGTDIQSQGYDHAPIVLGRDVWLGAHVVVMPGVTVADGAVVGSNAVVVGDVAAGAVVVGVPAREVRSRL
jgi:acetyltransferase-like isoleucine patch superfamily enzyme